MDRKSPGTTLKSERCLYDNKVVDIIMQSPQVNSKGVLTMNKS